VFAVTSPSPGAGKTSFTVALGLSFAASGSRTLLVDCDIVGAGLSSNLQKADASRCKLGRVLVRMGLLGERELAEALRLAKQEGRRLGEVAVKLGHITAESLERALEVQQKSKAGLLDVLAGEPLSECVAETGIAGLLVLPTGSSEARHASRLSPAAAHRLLEDARQRFDVVLVDTGPILGSVEASVVSSQADQVILIVSRGEQYRAASRSVEYLAVAGARVAGIVFNRALVDDSSVHGYGSDSGSYAPSRRPESHGTALARRLGPVAAAVQAFDN
jgi:Mrp family chromosome partitioning ATPase